MNSETSDQRMPAISGDGRWLAYGGERPRRRRSDRHLHSMTLRAKQVLAVPDLNSKSLDMQPALNGDGRLVAFASDRPGGAGGRDIYLS